LLSYSDFPLLCGFLFWYVDFCVDRAILCSACSNRRTEVYNEGMQHSSDIIMCDFCEYSVRGSCSYHTSYQDRELISTVKDLWMWCVAHLSEIRLICLKHYYVLGVYAAKCISADVHMPALGVCLHWHMLRCLRIFVLVKNVWTLRGWCRTSQFICLFVKLEGIQKGCGEQVVVIKEGDDNCRDL
jgi:hypothetical protein